jgi:hypothetical protein
MITCSECGYSGSPAEFEYIAQADEAGANTLRRCPGCGRLLIVDELEARQPENDEKEKPWGLSDLWGRKFSKRKQEGDTDEM